MQDLRFERNVWFLLGATKGGPMRARVMHQLLERPQNPNQLSLTLGVDYKTIRHHLGVLKKNNWVTSSQDRYGEMHFPAFTGEQRAVFDKVWAQIGKKL